MATPNMNLTLPVVGVTGGPDWATQVDAAFTTIDAHDHSPGNGVQINTAGIGINSDLTFAGFSATSLKTTRYQPNPTLGPLDVAALYVVSDDLFYITAAGVPVRITLNNLVNSPTTSIPGVVGNVSVSYVAAPNIAFVFQSNINTPANLDAGFIILRNPIANSNGLFLKAPTIGGSDLTMTLPSNPSAGTNKIMRMDDAGTMTASLSPDPATMQISGNLLGLLPTILVPSGAITAYGGSSAPPGYLLCDGTSYLNATYPDLFTAIGTSFGSVDGTHFNVPDLRGMFLRGWNGTNVPPYTNPVDPDAATRTAMNPGGNAGNNVGSIQADEIKAHVHSVPFVAQNSGTNVAGNIAQGTSSTSSGSTGGAETRPINAFVNYIIKY